MSLETNEKTNQRKTMEKLLNDIRRERLETQESQMLEKGTWREDGMEESR